MSDYKGDLGKGLKRKYLFRFTYKQNLQRTGQITKFT
jgi:hypothetical protein